MARRLPWLLVGGTFLAALVAAALTLALVDPATEDGDAGGVGPVVLGSRPRDLTATIDATARSLDDFWAGELPEVYGTPFRPLAGGLQPKTPDSSAFLCDGQALTYADVRGNAFYCGTGGDDFVVYDAALLLPRLDQAFGALTPAVVIAHEVGHAVQARAEVDAPSVLVELQADCFAGAWVAYARHSDADPVSVAQSGLDASVRALPALRDQPGTPASGPGAHGLGLDRVHAFQTGYEQGPDRCASIARGDVTVIELPFRTAGEAGSGGDLTYGETVAFAVDRLDAFWAASLPGLAPGASWRDPRLAPQRGLPLPSCPADLGYDASAVAAYCSTADTVRWSEAALSRIQESGDLATGATLAQAWARAAQVRAGAETAGEAATLERGCLTGAWVASLAAGDGATTLSPGDVDEALSAVLVPLSSQEDGAGSFARAEAYRSGLLSGVGAC